MVKVLITYKDVEYVGYEHDEDSTKKLHRDISRTVNAKGYYMLTDINGLRIMFPRHALINAVIKLIGEKEQNVK